MFYSAIYRSWAARGFVVFSLEHRCRGLLITASIDSLRDDSSIHTYTLEKQSDGSVKKTVIDFRPIDEQKDVVEECAEFNNLVRLFAYLND